MIVGLVSAYVTLVIIGLVATLFVVSTGKDRVFLRVNGEFKTTSKGITLYLWCFLLGPVIPALLMGFIIGVECGCNGEAFVKEEE